MIKKTIRMVLKLKDCDKIFHEDLGPGILLEQDHVYTLPEDYNETTFAAQLVYDEDDFLHRHIEVKLREVPNDS